MTNNLQLVVPPADQAEIETHLSALETLLRKHLHALTPKQRQDLFQLGDRATAFVTKVMDYGLLHPDRVPRGVDFAETQRDYGVIKWADNLTNRLKSMTYDAESTAMLGRADITSDVLAMYAQNKLDAHTNVPGAQAAVTEQGEHFAYRRRTKAAPTPK